MQVPYGQEACLRIDLSRVLQENNGWARSRNLDRQDDWTPEETAWPGMGKHWEGTAASEEAVRCKAQFPDQTVNFFFFFFFFIGENAQ